MLSRHADALYWMARYVERVDGTARLLEANLADGGDADAAVREARWRPALGIGRNLGAYAALHPDGVVTEDRVVRFVTVERTNPSAMRACLRLARDNAGVARAHLAPEMWEIVNALWHRAGPEIERAAGAETLLRTCRVVRGEVARFHGVTDATMPRGEAFEFRRLGTYVERADMAARLLDVAYRRVTPERSEAHGWGALLQALSGVEVYGRRHRAGVRAASVVELLVRDPDHPGSLRFALDQVVSALASVDPNGGSSAAMRTLDARLRAPADEIVRVGLPALLAHVVAGIADVDASLRAALFHTATELACAS